MSSLFDKYLHENESIFLNGVALDYDFQPKKVLYREAQQEYMARCMKPLFSKRNGRNILIHGPPGVGKTVCVKQVFNELDETTYYLIPIYINCWKKDTPHKIALEICSIIGYHFTHNKGTGELEREIVKILNKTAVVFCLDEVDKVSDFSILYSLLEDIYHKSIFLITNNREWVVSLDVRLQSRLTLDELQFEPYSPSQVREILSQRKDHAFVSGTFSDEAFETVVSKAIEVGDLRSGLFLLREAGNAAEERASRTVLLEHAKDAVQRLRDFSTKGTTLLEEDEKAIVEIVKIHSGLTVAEIYEHYKKDFSKSYRTFMRKVDFLTKNRLITANQVTSEKGGKTFTLRPSGGELRKLSEF